jgi:hypothetical protein
MLNDRIRKYHIELLISEQRHISCITRHKPEIRTGDLTGLTFSRVILHLLLIAEIHPFPEFLFHRQHQGYVTGGVTKR